MAIEIQVVGQGEEFGFRAALYGPIILCDHCGQRIDNAAEGAFVWGLRFEGEGREFTPIKFFHKLWKNGQRQSCALAWERFERDIEQHGYHHQWLELEDFVVFLANNLPGSFERKKRILAASKQCRQEQNISNGRAKVT